MKKCDEASDCHMYTVPQSNEYNFVTKCLLFNLSQGGSELSVSSFSQQCTRTSADWPYKVYYLKDSR